MAIDFTGFAFPKPSKGTAILERKAKRADIEKAEKAVKAAVTKRDGQKVCRLHPNCPHVKKGIRASVGLVRPRPPAIAASRPPSARNPRGPTKVAGIWPGWRLSKKPRTQAPRSTLDGRFRVFVP